ncbi:hypothetical protein [Snodgrassella alvi]|jgi:ATP-dependent DNA ligase|uniref:hypothetical protein n=1 Tax=Snodgrassella alvi TaxID=1196083 RepID=UPI000C1DD650|nr:hypothetical protein [Snodgrassella alvi]PIT43384.1 hypothetical protein BHC51_11155 [Snodgrassella alvi]
MIAISIGYSFPVARWSKNQDFIVLFFSTHKGVVIKAEDNSPYKMGEYKNDWDSCDSESWHTLEVTISG